MEREEFDRDIVGHVEEEDVAHVGEGDEGAKGSGAGNEEEEAAEDFEAADGDFVGLRCANRGPQDAHGRHIAERLDEGEEAREGHLQRDGFGETIGEHLAGEGDAEEEEEPFVQGTVAYSAAIKDRPDDGGEEGEDEETEREGVVDGFIAAATAGEDEGRFVVEDVDSGKGDDRSPGQDAGGIGQIDGRERDERGDDLRGEAVNAEVDEAEAEGNAGGEAPAGDGLLDLRLVEDGW